MISNNHEYLKANPTASKSRRKDASIPDDVCDRDQDRQRTEINAVLDPLQHRLIPNDGAGDCGWQAIVQTAMTTGIQHTAVGSVQALRRALVAFMHANRLRIMNDNEGLWGQLRDRGLHEFNTLAQSYLPRYD